MHLKVADGHGETYGDLGRRRWIRPVISAVKSRLMSPTAWMTPEKSRNSLKPASGPEPANTSRIQTPRQDWVTPAWVTSLESRVCDARPAVLARVFIAVLKAAAPKGAAVLQVRVNTHLQFLCTRPSRHTYRMAIPFLSFTADGRSV